MTKTAEKLRADWAVALWDVMDSDHDWAEKGKFIKVEREAWKAYQDAKKKEQKL